MASMPTDPRAVVERLNELINEHQTTGGGELFAPDARLVTAQGRVIDLAGLAAMLATSIEAFPDLRMDVTRWVVEGDTVVTEEVMQRTHKGRFAGLPPTNQAVRLPMAHVTRVVDGRIVERIAYHDTAGILRQLSSPARA